MGAINQEIAALRQEVAALRAQVAATDDWANGIHQALVAVLPFLLRGHPQAGVVQRLLASHDQRYELLLDQPALAEPDETAGQHESPMMLHRQLGHLGVWPGVDSALAARQTVERGGWQAPPGV